MRVEATAEFREWIDALQDLAGRARIQVRIEGLMHGKPGRQRILAGGIAELKVDSGPGYRVYYTVRGTRLLLLLIGGDKSSQAKDIVKARRLAKEFEE